MKIGELKQVNEMNTVKVGRGSTPSCKPLPFYIPFLTEKAAVRIPAIDSWYPFHITSSEHCIPYNCS